MTADTKPAARITWFGIVVNLVALLSIVIAVLSFAIHKLRLKADRFDQYCVSVHAEISTSIEMLDQDARMAFERFAWRTNDVERCTGLDMTWFADCRLKRDDTCAIKFMRDARAAIEVP